MSTISIVKHFACASLITWLCLGCATRADAGAPGPAGPPTEAEAPIVRVNREVGGHCTGFVIDARTVLTAAHCMWLKRPRNWIRPTSLHILVGYDRGDFRQHIRVSGYRVGPGYDPKDPTGRPPTSADWAILDLAEPFRGAPLPLAVARPAPGDVLAVTGYDAKRGHRLTRSVDCRVSKVGRAMFAHGCPAGHGHSGSPVFGHVGDRRAAFGLHVAIGGGQGFAILATSIDRDKAVRPY